MAMDLSINMDAGEIAEVRGQLIPDGRYLAKITEVKVNPSKSEANKGNGSSSAALLIPYRSHIPAMNST